MHMHKICTGVRCAAPFENDLLFLPQSSPNEITQVILPRSKKYIFFECYIRILRPLVLVQRRAPAPGAAPPGRHQVGRTLLLR
jgi:hypothetical protein